MLGNQSLWQTAKSCHELLTDAHVPYAIMGGVAVCLHGYQRNTVDLDLLVPSDLAQTARQALEGAGVFWDEQQREFQTPEGATIQFLLSGERAGKDSEVRLPEPADTTVVTELEGLTVLSLAALIESKIASGQGDLRRTHKDFADVVELIARHDLGRDYARHLHKSVRAAYRELVTNARGE